MLGEPPHWTLNNPIADTADIPWECRSQQINFIATDSKIAGQNVESLEVTNEVAKAKQTEDLITSTITGLNG